jgi:hypothetical protein
MEPSEWQNNVKRTNDSVDINYLDVAEIEEICLMMDTLSFKKTEVELSEQLMSMRIEPKKCGWKRKSPWMKFCKD